jgi:hypothetical protein
MFTPSSANRPSGRCESTPLGNDSLLSCDLLFRTQHDRQETQGCDKSGTAMSCAQSRRDDPAIWTRGLEAISRV